jgi:glycosyltransferase involved in cell wall biosynthesis
MILFELGHGGAENIMHNLAINLSKKFEVHILILSDNLGHYFNQSENIKIHSLKVSRIRHGFLKSLIFFKKDHYDVIFFNLWPVSFLMIFSLLFSRPLKFWKTRRILFEHSVLSEQYSNKGLLSKILIKASVYIFYNLADKVVSVSKGVKEELENFGLSKTKSILLPNPLIIKNNKLRLTSKQKIILNNWLKNKFKIIAIGSLKHQKDYPLMIRSIQQLVHRYNNNANLLIVGEGPLYGDLVKYRNKLTMENNIFFLGSVDNPFGLLEKANIYLSTSKSESFGLSILEALSTGTTVVSTDCNYGPREILGENYKYLTEFNEKDIAKKIELACLHPIQEDELKEKTFKYSFDDYVKKLDKIIDLPNS